MICPCCSREMEHGYIEADNRREINWKPNKTICSMDSMSCKHNEGAVMLSPYSFKRILSVDYNRIHAYLCRDCNKIVIDVPNAKAE